MASTGGDTKANRTPCGWKAWMADAQGTGTAGTPQIDLAANPFDPGTGWWLFPGCEEITVDDGTEFEDFNDAFYLSKSDSDIVASGIKGVSLTIKETALASVMIGFASRLQGTLAGTPGWDTGEQPLLNSDFPEKQLILERQGPDGRTQLVHIPRCKRTPKEWIKTAQRKIATLLLNFECFVVKTVIYPDGVHAFPQGATHKLYQRQAAA